MSYAASGRNMNRRRRRRSRRRRRNVNAESNAIKLTKVGRLSEKM
jgi:hypothetical protein